MPHRQHASRDQMIRPDNLAYGLGLFSIGLGLVEMMAPHALSRWLGMHGQERLLQAYGAREMANGVAILRDPDASSWVWTRVAGDALDLATLAPALRQGNRQRDNVVIAMAAVAGVTALDLYCASRLSSEEDDRRGALSMNFERL